MYIGYAQVSTQDQHLELQEDALRRAGCEKIVVDRVSGTVAKRPGLNRVKDLLRKGDTLVVWRLDRLGRSIKDLIGWMSWFEQHGIGLCSLQEAIDTTSTSGKLTFHIFVSLTEFERQLIQERTRAGLNAARARGRLGGRPKALKPGRQQRALQLYHTTELTVKKICEMMGISKLTFMPMCARPKPPRSPTPHFTSRKGPACPNRHEDKNGRPRPKNANNVTPDVRHLRPGRFWVGCHLAAHLMFPRDFVRSP